MRSKTNYVCAVSKYRSLEVYGVENVIKGGIPNIKKRAALAGALYM